MKIFIATILTIISLGIFTTVIVKSISFNQNCGGYLKRAADANTIEMAQTELKRTLDYLEENDITKGYTSVMWRTPDEDVEFWYNNIKTSYAELEELSNTATSLEKSNMLIKLRETLMDSGEKGSHITVPDGISRFPNNLMWGILLCVAILIIVGLCIWVAIELNDY